MDAVAKRKENLYFELEHQLKAIPEVIEHIEAKHGHIPLAVVSGSRRKSVVHSLSALGLLDKFDVLVCAEDYPRQARAGLLSDRGGAARRGARRLPRLRRHGDGHRGRDRGRHGLGAGADGARTRLTQTGAFSTFYLRVNSYDSYS